MEMEKKNNPRSERKGKIAELKLCCSHGTQTETTKTKKK